MSLRPLLLVVLLLVSFFTASGCAHAPQPPRPSSETTADVLRVVASVAGSRHVVARVGAAVGLPAGWLDTPYACAVSEVVRQAAQAAVNSLDASPPGESPRIVEGTLDLRACLSLGDAPSPGPGAVLVLGGVIDAVQGSMLLAGVPRKDPRGYGAGCGVLEFVRDGGVSLLREASLASDGRVRWSTHELDAERCEGAVVARASSAGT